MDNINLMEIDTVMLDDEGGVSYTHVTLPTIYRV